MSISELLNKVIEGLRNIFKNIDIKLYSIEDDLITISFKIKYFIDWEYFKISISDKIPYDDRLIKQLIKEGKENIIFYIYNYFIKEGEKIWKNKSKII